MSFRSLLTDKCDIYHLQKEPASPQYGIPGNIVFEYNKLPDAEEVPCKFTERKQSITQGEPGAKIIHAYNVCLLPATDIRLNDKLIFQGMEFKTQIPRKVKNHHIEVIATREGFL